MKLNLNNSKFIELDKTNNIFNIIDKETGYAMVTKLKGLFAIGNYSEKDNELINKILNLINEKL